MITEQFKIKGSWQKLFVSDLSSSLAFRHWSEDCRQLTRNSSHAALLGQT